MADGVKVETTEIIQQPRGKFSRAWEAIRNFRKVKKTEQVDKNQVSDVEIKEKIKQPSLQEILDKALSEKGVKSLEFRSEGVSEFFKTNETFDNNAYKEISKSNEAPNGYIIGVGTSSILAAMELFSDSEPPKGLILINIDPSTIRDARGFVQKLGNSKLLYGHMGEVKEYDIDSLKGWDIDGYQQKFGSPPASESVWNQAQKLKQLAQEGKIAVLEQNLFNPSMLEVLKQNLPDALTSRNVLYLSNVGDWMRRAWENKNAKIEMQMASWPEAFRKEMEDLLYRDLVKDFERYNLLKALQPQPPSFNYCIDTSELPTAGTKPYLQRVTRTLPGISRYSR